MIRAAAILTLLAAPAMAQDADPAGQLVEAYVACLHGGGEVATTEGILTGLGWARAEAGEDGLVYFIPSVGEDTQVYMADDGSFCHAESFSVGTEAAAQILLAAVESDGNPPYEPSQDEAGCSQLIFAGQVSATLTSGGNDPVCASDSDSAVRFEPVAQE
jgi:hypothetical protein